jgi:hypothetical protein
MIKRVLVGIATLVLAVAVVTVVNQSSASAYSDPTRTAQYWWPHNGCSSPTGDAPSGVSFTYACNHHDGCYILRWSSSKSTCDQWFLNDMRNACAGGFYCNTWAYAYYLGVSTLGWPYWWCQCDPTFRPLFA